jgi:2-polyprenyl-3-methyl-5-hydroxy-6-metoxy-1,4-benzoquinol methylase
MNVLYTHKEDIKRLNFIKDQVLSLQNKNIRILDVGCGNGIISIALGSLGFEVVGIDIDPTSIQLANEYNPYPNVRFMVQDIEDEMLHDSFDVVICSEVLEHLYHPEKIIKDIHDSMKPDSLFIVTTPNGYGPREVLMTRPMQAINRYGFGTWLLKLKKLLGYAGNTIQSSNPDLEHIQFFKRSDLINLIESYGFRMHAFGRADVVDRVFPFSILANRFPALQELDCKMADILPRYCTSGFYTSWKLVAKHERERRPVVLQVNSAQSA